MTKNEVEKMNSFETTINVCCHDVAIRYWDFEAELTDDLKEILIEEGERRAKEMINDEYSSGNLNCLYVDGELDTEEEIGGWWEILRD